MGMVLHHRAMLASRTTEFLFQFWSSNRRGEGPRPIFHDQFGDWDMVMENWSVYVGQDPPGREPRRLHLRRLDQYIN